MASPASLVEDRTLGITSDLLNQNLHFNQTPRYFIGKLKFKKQRSMYAFTPSEEVLKRTFLPINSFLLCLFPMPLITLPCD